MDSSHHSPKHLLHHVHADARPCTMFHSTAAQERSDMRFLNTSPPPPATAFCTLATDSDMAGSSASGRDEGDGVGSGSPRSRIRWTPTLHASFLRGIQRAGGITSATPKAVLLHMEREVPGLTLLHVKSHLQRYRKVMGRGRPFSANAAAAFQSQPALGPSLALGEGGSCQEGSSLLHLTSPSPSAFPMGCTPPGGLPGGTCETDASADPGASSHQAYALRAPGGSLDCLGSLDFEQLSQAPHPAHRQAPGGSLDYFDATAANAGCPSAAHPPGRTRLPPTAWFSAPDLDTSLAGPNGSCETAGGAATAPLGTRGASADHPSMATPRIRSDQGRIMHSDSRSDPMEDLRLWMASEAPPGPGQGQGSSWLYLGDPDHADAHLNSFDFDVDPKGPGADAWALPGPGVGTPCPPALAEPTNAQVPLPNPGLGQGSLNPTLHPTLHPTLDPTAVSGPAGDAGRSLGAAGSPAVSLADMSPPLSWASDSLIGARGLFKPRRPGGLRRAVTEGEGLLSGGAARFWRARADNGVSTGLGLGLANGSRLGDGFLAVQEAGGLGAHQVLEGSSPLLDWGSGGDIGWAKRSREGFDGAASSPLTRLRAPNSADSHVHAWPVNPSELNNDPASGSWHAQEDLACRPDAVLCVDTHDRARVAGATLERATRDEPCATDVAMHGYGSADIISNRRPEQPVARAGCNTSFSLDACMHSGSGRSGALNPGRSGKPDPFAMDCWTQLLQASQARHEGGPALASQASGSLPASMAASCQNAPTLHAAPSPATVAGCHSPGLPQPDPRGSRLGLLPFAQGPGAPAPPHQPNLLHTIHTGLHSSHTMTSCPLSPPVSGSLGNRSMLEMPQESSWPHWGT